MIEGRLQADRGATIEDFFALVKQTWDLTQEGTETPVQFYEAFPAAASINETLPVITYTEVRHLPQPEMRERKPRIRHVGPDPTDPNTQIIVTGQRFDHYVGFEVWTTTNQDTKLVAGQFEDFMTLYIGLFKQMGTQDVWFEESVLGSVSTNLPKFLEDRRCRTLIYKVTIETLKQFDLTAIESVKLKVLGLN